jgi:hypothetical protein
MNLLLKGASMLATEPEQCHGRRVAWHNLAGKNKTTGLIPQLSCLLLDLFVSEDVTGGLKLLGTCANHTSAHHDQYMFFCKAEKY